eukprot:TRINITY_DN5871_c0_g3_i1.p1 TRINITY_DN5871_c0_g3~~TRINITY_DN5871_c0_g3_i1.p1  ORF type:complete len:751 (-),score=162.94 TRINITY_DN5871_c0_g3_i1:505-2757(-)
MMASESITNRIHMVFGSGAMLCAESGVQVVEEAGGKDSAEIIRAATGFCSGASRTCGQCGAVSGAIMGIGLYAGRSEPGGDHEACYALVQEFLSRFKEVYNSINCYELTGCDFTTPEGQKRFREHGVRQVCLDLAADAAELALSLLRKHGYLPEEDDFIHSRMAPCGLLCGKCVAFADGPVQRLSAELHDQLGSNFSVYAQRFTAMNPVFKQYPAFAELLDFLASGSCGGCREQGCLFQACKVADCAKAHDVGYCFQCEAFPCEQHGMPDRLAEIWRGNNGKMQASGVEAWFLSIKDKPRYPQQMIKKIIIDNFMAHEHTELELGPGVTILTGSNNTGKSAVVEALRCLATNPTPSYFIRHGAKEARVAVELEDGTKVVWVRTKRWAMYELWRPGAAAPEEYHKLQRKVPEDIAEVLRLDLVELETGRKVDIHVGNQREPVFLLNQSSDTAAFFAASTESAHLLAMQNLLKRRTLDAKREERDLETQVSRILGEIEVLSPLPGIELQLETAHELEQTATQLQSAVPVLESVLAEQRGMAASLEESSAAATVLAKTDAPPTLNEVRPLHGAVQGMATVGKQLDGARKLAATLMPLTGPPETQEAGSLLRLAESIAGTEQVLLKAADRQAVLAGLAALPVRAESRELAEFLDEFIAMHYRHARLARGEGLLRKVAEPPRPEPVASLGSTVASLADITARVEERKRALDDLENDLRGVVDTLEERIRKLGCCPTCGGDLTTATFLDHGCRHDA